MSVKSDTLQAIIDELRTILNLKRGDSLIEAVKQLAALKANQKQPFVLTQEILTDLQNKYQDRGYCEDLVHEVIDLCQNPDTVTIEPNSSEKRDCDTCKHGSLHETQQPCADCFLGSDWPKWEPIQAP